MIFVAELSDAHLVTDRVWTAGLFAHHRSDCDAGQIGTGEAMTEISGARPGFEIQPGTVLRECEAWTVADRNSRNARVFGARYWREG